MGSPLGAANYVSSVGCRKPKKVGKHWLEALVVSQKLW